MLKTLCSSYIKQYSFGDGHCGVTGQMLLEVTGKEVTDFFTWGRGRQVERGSVGLLRPVGHPSIH